jgi:hypothetical protein
MMSCGRSHRSSAKFTMGGHHLANCAEGPAAKFASNLVGAIKIGINHSQQANGLPLLFEFFVDTGVVSSEDAHTHHCNGNRILRRQENSRRQVPETNCKRKSSKQHLDSERKPLIRARDSGQELAHNSVKERI